MMTILVTDNTAKLQGNTSWEQKGKENDTCIK